VLNHAATFDLEDEFRVCCSNGGHTQVFRFDISFLYSSDQREAIKRAGERATRINGSCPSE
jgi:hypothetical protein